MNNNSLNDKDINTTIENNLNVEGENIIPNNDFLEQNRFLTNLNCFVNKEN